MKISLLTSLALASVLSLGAFGCASSTDDVGAATEQEVTTAPAKTINATTEERFQSLGGVWNVQGIDSEAGLELKVIEAGGGDPAMNGNYLFLSAFGPDHGDGGVYDLGLNVRTLDSATFVGPDTVKLVGKQDTIDMKTNEPTQIAFEALVKLTLVENNIQSTLDVTFNGEAPSPVERTTEAGYGFFDSIYGVQTKESAGAGHIIRLFETGGGDPAMNGDHLVLNIMSYPEEATYELELNVNSVEKFEVTDTQIFIAGGEHTMNNQGDIVTKPYAYTIDYTIGADGVPGAIKLTKTN